jgi:hypothetical protein
VRYLNHDCDYYNNRDIIIIIIIIIIGATGIVTRSLRKNLEAVQGKHSIDLLQKTAILGNITHNTESTAV